MPSARPTPQVTQLGPRPTSRVRIVLFRHRRWIGIGAVVIAGFALIAILSVDFTAKRQQRMDHAIGQSTARAQSTLTSMNSQAPESLTVSQLRALSDEDLARLDPLIVNLAVAKGIPGLESLDVARYRTIMDEWALLIARGLSAAEPIEAGSELYRRDPDLWRVGSMAIALGGPSFGVT